MPFDNYVVGAVCRELNNLLVCGRIERVYQPEREEIILCVNRPPFGGRPPGRYNLLISANANRPSFYITDRREAGPGNPPAFCMLLRKYLVGARIEAFRQIPGERIVHIDVLSSGELGLREPRTLVFELMGKHSNIIFLNGSVIVDAIKRISGDMSRVRQTLPGMEYSLPPPGKGISPVMEEEVSRMRTVDSNPPGKGLEYYNGLAEKGEYTPILYYKEEKPVDFHVFRLSVYEGLATREFDGETAVSDMLEIWYESRETQGRLSLRANELRSVLKARLDKQYLKKQRLSEELDEAGRAESLKETGDLITANIWRIEKGSKRVALEDYMSNGAVRNIDLDPRLSPAGNAQRFYKLYNKAKTAAVVKKKQLEETQNAIDYLEGVMHFANNADSLAELDGLRFELTETGYIRPQKGAGAKKGKGSRMLHGGIFDPHKYTLPSGARLLVGRNNSENDELTLRVAAKTDYWFHTKDIPGSHVILKPAGPEPGETDLRSAAETAAWYSKARDSEGVPVDYTIVRYVKKPSGARPGYVIFTNNRTLYVTPRLPE
jgi:predicted ribosome quality control (RQC) complex YloA/Tae2 family protein